MIDLDKILTRITALEREVAVLRAQTRRKRSEERVYVSEVAEKFGVSTETVRRMQGEFAGLWEIHVKTETNRIYWHRRDYQNWLAAKNEPVSVKAARAIRNAKLIRRKK